jgi:TonB family protein
VDLNDPELTRPVLVSEAKPRYPPLAQRMGIEGTVALSAKVDENGTVVEVSVARVDPPGQGFDAAAVRYVKSRRYRPATKGGVAVSVRMEVVVEFRKPR